MEKEGFIDLVDQLSTVATLNKWITFYDKSADFFVWKKDRLSKDVSLVKVSHDTYLYLTPKRTVEGVCVEYLRNNFTKHNVEYKEMIKFFDKKSDDDYYTISKITDKTRCYFDKFAETLKADIYKDALTDKKTAYDLNSVISVALS